jgi:hypothetical protein
MSEADIEIILQGAKEKYPEAPPRIISDNDPQFIAKDFKEFIRIASDAPSDLPGLPANRTGRSSAGANRSKGSAPNTDSPAGCICSPPLSRHCGSRQPSAL